jgi:hypothetical protein
MIVIPGDGGALEGARVLRYAGPGPLLAHARLTRSLAAHKSRRIDIPLRRMDHART